MNKKILVVTSMILAGGILATYAAPPVLEEYDPNTGKKVSQSTDNNQTKVELTETTKFDTKTVYYPNANLKSSIAKYKAHNYTGSIQELLSLVKKDPSSAAAYYYLALSYTQIGDGGNALKAYDKAISLNSNSTITEYAKKGRDCLIDGPLCHPEQAQTTQSEEESDLDKFIKAPYGNGLSPEVNMQIKQKQLNTFQQEINKKDKLDNKDIQKIEKFDSRQDDTSLIESGIKIASAEPSDEEILSAIKTLKNAGLTVNIQSQNQSQNQYYKDPQLATQNEEMAQLSAMLGGTSNNKSSSIDMIPYLMNADGTAKKDINPQMIQAMLLNSSMMNFDFNNSSENK